RTTHYESIASRYRTPADGRVARLARYSRRAGRHGRTDPRLARVPRGVRPVAGTFEPSRARVLAVAVRLAVTVHARETVGVCDAFDLVGHPLVLPGEPGERHHAVGIDVVLRDGP